MGLDIIAYRVTKDPAPDSSEFDISYSNTNFIEYMKDYVFYKQELGVNWPKTLKQYHIIPENILDFDIGDPTSVIKAKDRDVIIDNETLIYEEQATPYLHCTEIEYQRKNVGTIYRKWLCEDEYIFKGGDTNLNLWLSDIIYPNTYTFTQKQFEKVYDDYQEEEYSSLQQMYNLLAEPDVFIHNSW